MTDGRTFTVRRHSSAAQRDSFHKSAAAAIQEINRMQLREQFHVLDNMPLAFCVIELVFDKDGKGADFIFRYCNKEMEKLEGKPLLELMNRSFYDIFKNADRKWLIYYADVALNGVQRIVHKYSPEIDKHLTVYCFQPIPGFCACTLVEAPPEETMPE